METTPNFAQDIHINCLKHPTETIQRVSTNLEANPHIFCLECLLESQQSLADILKISEFLQIADDFYKANPQNPKTTDLKPPPEYFSVMKDQKKALEELKDHIQQEKQKIDQVFDQIKETFVQLLDEQKRECLNELDQQLFKLQYWHTFFEKRLQMTFSDLPNSEKSYIEKLQTIKDPLQFEAYIRSIKEDLNEEILRINKPKSLDQDRKFKLPSLYKELIEQQNKKPIYDISHSFDIEKELKTNIKNLLEKVLFFQNSIPDVLDDCNCPDSQIIEASHYKLLTQWLSEDYKHKNLKLLYRGTRDGMSASAFHEKCDKSGLTITLIHCEFYTSSKKAIIGGFLDKDWNSNNDWIASDQAFLFSLTEKVKCPLSVCTDCGYSAYGGADKGPTFGPSHELTLNKDFKTNYVWPQQQEYVNIDLLIDRRNQKDLCDFENEKSFGMNYFQVQEIEVYTFK